MYSLGNEKIGKKLPKLKRTFKMLIKSSNIEKCVVLLYISLIFLANMGSVASATTVIPSVNSLGFNQNGILASAREDGKVTLWNVSSGSIIRQLSVNYPIPPPYHEVATTGLFYSPDGTTLSTSSLDSVARLWNVSSGSLRSEFKGHEEGVLTTAISPDGKLVATGGEDTKVMIWDVQSSKLKDVLEGHKNFVRSVVFLSNTIIASGSDDGVIKLWNISNNHQLLSLGGGDGAIDEIAISPDKLALASGTRNGVVKEWNISTGQLIRTYMTNGSSISAVVYSPKGNILVAATEDGNIRVWSRSTGSLIINLALNTNIRALAYSIDAKTIANAGVNGTINLWNTATWKNYLTLIEQNITSGTTFQITNQIANARITPKYNNMVNSQALIQGPGGPILIITSNGSSNPFGNFYTEILRNEGFNAFQTADISAVSASTLSSYDLVILAEMKLSQSQVTMLSNWVSGGGRLIAMRPDSQLTGLLGLNGPSGSINGSYILFNSSNSAGNGLVSQTVQFKGNADIYTLNGANSIATLYSDSNTPTSNPAVTINNIGSGKAASFTYDLARSLIYMRQGNPAWVNTSGPGRDGYSSLRSDDLYYGNAPWDNESDWIDLNKVAIPQADEQQRLLGNMIITMMNDIKPMLRFWYLPNGYRAAVVMTGDDHANGGTPGRFDQYIALSPANCSGWQCIRSTSYVYPDDINYMNDSQALSYQNQGFEVGIHVQSNCADYTPDELETYYATQIDQWHTYYPSLILPDTHRMHCIAWDGWTVQPSTELNHSILLDTSYYYWPPSWVTDRPGFFTGSGMPMRYVDLNGGILDVYQAESQMTDESGQSYPLTSNSLLDKAIGPEQFFGVFTANEHTDYAISAPSDAVIGSALTRGIPIISSRELLNWLHGRENSTYSNVSWNGSILSFLVTNANANGLMVMIPAISNAGTITGVNFNGSPAPYLIENIKGINYAFITANTGTFSVTYAPDYSQPMVIGNTPLSGTTGVSISSSVAATFNVPLNDKTVNSSTFQLFGPNGTPIPANVSYNASTYVLTLKPSNSLSYSTKYTVVVKGTNEPRLKDITGNSLAQDYSWSFTTGNIPICPCNIWTGSPIPVAITQNDPNPVELGVKFQSDFSGYITGIRFYKAPYNTGTHIGSLWSSTGTLLGRVTFSAETTSGWQQALFSSPINVTAGTTYIASYHANADYSGDNYYFATGVDNPPLHALKDGFDGGNGVYVYGSTPTFPSSSYLSSNYWVDVIFNTVQTYTPMPINLASTQGNFWVKYTWEPSSGGNNIDSYNVSINGMWTNGSSNTYINNTVGPHGWSNITVYAYNNSNKQLSTVPATQNTVIANNVPVQDHIGPKNVSAGQTLVINIHAIDADNDTILYGTNTNKGTLDPTSGIYSWSTNITDIGNYTWYFNSSDGYGGIASETITVTVNNASYIPPNITSWSNNKTNDNNLAITVNTGDIVNFNATANQTITSWNWYKDNVNQNNNYDNISISWNTSGTKIVQVNATNNNGTSNTITWNITVLPLVYIPPSPANISSATGNFWINISWQSGSGNLTDSYNVSVNGIWNNGTMNTSINNSLVPHAWQNVTVYAFNVSGGGSLSTLPATENVQIPDNPPIQSQIGNKAVEEGQWINFTVNSTDIDNDTITYGTNATKGIFNTTTGNYSWLTKFGDAGVYIWNFNSSDGYGGIANENVGITVINIPLNITAFSPSSDPETIYGTQQNFNITLNKTANITWYMNSAKIQSNTSVSSASYTNSTANVGIWNITASATDGIGTLIKSWNWTINYGNYIPPRPINLQNKTGNFWVNYTWLPGIGNITDSYNISVNGIWNNDTNLSGNGSNITTLPHGWVNITVFAYNSSGIGSLSMENINQNTQVPNNPPIQIQIGNKAIDEGQLLTFTVSSTDIDNDKITYGTNASKGSFNTTSGQFSWTPDYRDAGNYIWYFNSSDGYSGVASETINVTVNSVPLSIINSSPIVDPISIIGMQQTFGISLNRTANVTWYINGAQIQNNTGVISDSYTNSTADIGNYNITAIASDGYYYANRIWNWTVIPKPTYNLSGYVFDNYGSGLGNVAIQNGSYHGTSTSSGYYLITGLNNGMYNFNYSRAGFNTGYLNVIINGLDNNSANITIYDTTPPASIYNTNSIAGNFYINNTWNNPSDADFNYTWFRYSNGTNLQNVSSSISYLNISWSPHYVQNISAQTVDMYGNINQNKVWFNNTIPDNPPIQSSIGNKTVIAGNILQFNVTSTDIDSDPIIYGTNATGGSLNATTGVYLWQTTSNDVGIYTWNFNSSDNYGGVTNEIITVNVTAAPPSKYQPPVPSITSTQGNFWINYSLQPGSGNLTDSYNVSINGNWTNGTKLSSYNNTVGPHNWSNITVWAYNNSDGGSLSNISVSLNTQVANNVPVQNVIGNKSVDEGQWLNFTVKTTDIDQDPIIYETNATKGNLNSTSGNFSWLTTYSDIGNYTWYFNSSDNYGGVSTETITITVNNTSPVFTSYSPLSDPISLQGSVQNFNVTTDRIVNITWLVNGSVIQTNSSIKSANYTNSSAGSGTYNITVIAIDGYNGYYYASKQWNWTVNPVYPPNIISWSNNKTHDENLTLTVNMGIINFNATANQTITSWNWNLNGVNQNNNYDNFTTTWNTAGSNIINVNGTNNNGTSNTITWNITVPQVQMINYIPPDPISMSNNTGNFWINYSWNNGIGNITDSYNVSTNGIWNNGTLNKFKNMTTVPHGWVNITVWAYNSSGTGNISTGNVSQNLQVPNNPPIQGIIGNKSVIAGNLLNFTVMATDVDNDTIIYGSNATKGVFNVSTGVYSWQTTINDNGTYTWYFNSSDGYGGIASETITINVGTTTIPMVIGNSPVSGSTGINISTAVNATFNKVMNNLTINTSTFELHKGNLTGSIVPANVSYNNSTFVASLRPTSALIKSTNYTALIKGGSNDPRVKDLAGNSLTTNFIWNFTTSICPCSIWNASAKPGTISENDPNAVELGVKFKSDVNGSITGIRFYKGPSNTGTHVGSLWSSTGTLLGRATFSGETASGWQQVNFTTPVNVTVNISYVASYHTNVGYYSEDDNYFANSGVDNPPLHALKNGVSGNDGVYIYNANPIFPTNGYLSSNYWIDVVFVTR